MLETKLNGELPQHIDRVAPKYSVSNTGEINWLSVLLDYNPALFYRGKTVTNDEFNELFLQQCYQNNYLADSLTELFKEHLSVAIQRTFTKDFGVSPSYTKVFNAAAWGTRQPDGYYYITIPAAEHGFTAHIGTDQMAIDTEMYILEHTTGKFFEVLQIETKSNNDVVLYTDDSATEGFVVIRPNDRSYSVIADTIDATQVRGLAPVAMSAKYTDLIDIYAPTGPNSRLDALENAVDNLTKRVDNLEQIGGKANA